MKRCILFDFDGTLADTFSTTVAVLQELAKTHGRKIGSKTLRNLGFSTLFKQEKVPFIQIPRLLRTIHDGIQQEIQTIPLFPYWKPVLRKLAKTYRLGIFTSNAKSNVETFLKKHELSSLFTFIYTDSSVFGKHIALRRLCKIYKLQPTEIVYVGDENRDIQAGRKLGITVIAVSWGYNSKCLLQKEKAEYIIQSPKELVEIIDTLK